MLRDKAEKLLSVLESIMYYRDELNEHPNDQPRNKKLCEELGAARERAIDILEGVEHTDAEDLF